MVVLLTLTSYSALLSLFQVTHRRRHGEPRTKDHFTIRVVDPDDDLDPSRAKPVEYPADQSVISPVRCPPGSAITTATVVIDADLAALSASERVHLLRHLCNHLDLPTSLVRLRSPPTDRPLFDTGSALVSGPGDVEARPRYTGVLVQWDVGCGNVRAELMPSLELLETDSRLGEAIGLPVVGWHVTKNRRQRSSPLSARRAGKPLRYHATPTPLMTAIIRPTVWPGHVTTTVTSAMPSSLVESSRVVSVEPTRAPPTGMISPSRVVDVLPTVSVTRRKLT
jgi:hypothetical protein